MEEQVSSIITGVLRQDRAPKTNYMSLSMTEGLMRVASTRIFTVPEQSFMELIANSIDSYNTTNRIGKFGMGFYSIFYWLYMVSNSKITIETTYEKDGKLESYIANIWQTEKGPYVRIDPTENKKNTGTVIIVSALYNVNNALNQLKKFKHNKSAKISIVTPYDHFITYGEGEETVQVEMTETSFTVIDIGPGIPFDIFVDTMLVPSISTKTRPKSIPYKVNPNVKLFKGNMSIVVGGIVIYSTKNTYKKGFLIELPVTTPLPVARDDVILTKEVADHIYSQLIVIVDKFIRVYNVTDLLDALTEYANYSPQTMAKSLVNRVKSYINSYDGIILVEDKSDIKKYLLSLKNSIKGFPRIVTAPYMSIYKIEKVLNPYLEKIAIKEKKFHLKDVVHYKGKTIFLSKYILTDTSIEDWDTRLLVSSDSFILYPYGYKGGIQNNYLVEMGYKSEEDKNLAYTLISVWNSITKNSYPDYGLDDEIVGHTLAIKALFPKGDTFKEYVISLISTLSEVKYDFTYGAKREIYYDSIGIFERSFLKRYSKVVYPEHTKECIFWFLQTIPKVTTGGFSWFPNLETCVLIEKIPYEYAMEGFSKCLNPAEKIIFANVSHSEITDYTIPGLADMVVSEIQRFGGKKIETIFIKEMGKYISNTGFNELIMEPLKNSIKVYVAKFKGISTYPKSGKWRVTSDQLSTYLYTTDRDISGLDTIEIMKRASKSTYPVNKLKTVSIAVNEGTTKDYGASIITELVQNSIDASRTNNIKDPINVTLKSDAIVVKDSVGINSKDLAYILIPFVSSKDANDPNVTGEMGTGFFNIYRECYAVHILTKKDGIANSIFAMPIFNSDGMVENISYNFDTIDNYKEKGTTITVYLSKDKIKRTKTLTDVNIYLTKYLSYVDHPVLVNGDLITSAKTMINENKYAKIYITDDITIPSFVMTNGVPFADFDTFMGNYNIYGVFLNLTKLRVIIDIKNGVYLPSQSRTKLSIKGDEMGFNDDLNDMLHSAIIEIYLRDGYNRPDSIIPFTSSTSPYSELKVGYRNYEKIGDLSKITCIDLIKSYNNFIYNLHNIACDINHAIDTMVEGKYDEKKLGYHKVVSKWMSNKSKKKIKIKDIKIVGTTNNKILIDDTSSSSTTTKKDDSVNDAVIMVSLQMVVSKIWSLLYSIQKTESFGGTIGLEPPKVLSSFTPGLFGYYSSKDHHIVLNSKDYNPNDIEDKLIELGTKFKEDKNEALVMIRNDPIMTKLMGPMVPATTLLHELLHAVMNTNHTDSSHDNPPFKVNGKNMSFNETAVELYKLACDMGLYEIFK